MILKFFCCFLNWPIKLYAFFINFCNSLFKLSNLNLFYFLWPAFLFKSLIYLFWFLAIIQKQPLEMLYTKAGQARSSATLFKKRFQHRCLPVNIAKFLRTSILKNICERLLVFYKLVISKRFLNPFLTFPKSSATFASSLFNSFLNVFAP